MSPPDPAMKQNANVDKPAKPSEKVPKAKNGLRSAAILETEVKLQTSEATTSSNHCDAKKGPSPENANLITLQPGESTVVEIPKAVPVPAKAGRTRGGSKPVSEQIDGLVL